MLKSIYKRLLFFCLLIFLSLPAFAAEYIEHFDSNIIVNSDGSLTITETITIHHEGNKIKRGIYRDLSTAKHEKYKVINVTRNNKPEPWFTEKKGHYFRINTGNEDFLPAPATSTFTITYNMYDVLRPIKDTDLNEIYLNVTGVWFLPIHHVTTQVSYPEGTNISTRYAYVQNETYDYTSLPNHAYAFNDLPVGAQLTIAESFSKGTVNIQLPLAWRALIAAFIIMFIYYFVAWLLWGIDPPSRAIMPDWEPPANLSPLECAYINNNGKTPSNSFFLHILWLIHQKAVSLREVQRDDFKHIKGYEIKPLPTADKAQSEIKLFTTHYPNWLTIYDNEPDENLVNYNMLLEKNIERHLEKTAYHKRNIQTAIGALFVPIALCCFLNTDIITHIFMILYLLSLLISKNILGIIIALFTSIPFVIMLAEKYPSMLALPILYVATVIVFKYLMFQPTVYGQRQKEKIEGIKMFLGTITQNKNIALKEHLPLRKNYDMSMHNRLTPEDMEALFPFAVALGLEKAWERKFKSIFDTKQWIAMTDRNFYYQNRSFNNFNRFYQSSIKATHASAAAERFSSGAGSFGGGFSGGGFGGGGGGGR